MRTPAGLTIPARGRLRIRLATPGHHDGRSPSLGRGSTVSGSRANGPGRREALAAFGGLLAAVASPAGARDVAGFGAAPLRGAGSSFAGPLLAAWADDYRRWRHGAIALAAAGGGLDSEPVGPALDYEPVGSEAGIERLKAGAVDFAISELPLGSAESTAGRLIQQPLVAGAVAIGYRLPGAAGGIDPAPPLKLDADVVAAIFSGRVRRWNDPAIAALNQGRPLPDAPIAVIHRSDGSGTTYTLTHWLAAANRDWAARIGAGPTVRWPLGTGVRGSSAVIAAILAEPGAIGYVNLVEARQRGVDVASIRNRAGRFVAPSAASVRAAVDAVATADPNGTGEAAARAAPPLLDAPGEAAWPIVATVYGLVDAAPTAAARRARRFLDWAVTVGIDRADRLGYVGLPIDTPVRSTRGAAG